MRAIITVLGRDRAGIIAAVSGLLFRHDVNILDISQTILSGYFTMVMLVDIGRMSISLSQMQDAFSALATELSVEIQMQRSEIFDAMHRV